MQEDLLKMRDPFFITEKQLMKLDRDVRAEIPFNIRRTKQINKNLKTKAIVDGFISFPIYTYLEEDRSITPSWDDDLPRYNCPYVMETLHHKSPLDSSYKNSLYLKNALAPFFEDDFGKELNVTLDDFLKMTFSDFSNIYDDVALSEIF